MNLDASLDTLESDVLLRIAAHRQTQKSLRALPVAAVVCCTALASGWLAGSGRPHHRVPRSSSEAALLAEDVGLAPSSLLVSNQ
jgi:hypothetical protein